MRPVSALGLIVVVVLVLGFARLPSPDAFSPRVHVETLQTDAIGIADGTVSGNAEIRSSTTRTSALIETFTTTPFPLPSACPGGWGRYPLTGNPWAHNATVKTMQFNVTDSSGYTPTLFGDICGTASTGVSDAYDFEMQADFKINVWDQETNPLGSVSRYWIGFDTSANTVPSQVGPGVVVTYSTSTGFSWRAYAWNFSNQIFYSPVQTGEIQNNHWHTVLVSYTAADRTTRATIGSTTASVAGDWSANTLYGTVLSYSSTITFGGWISSAFYVDNLTKESPVAGTFTSPSIVQTRIDSVSLTYLVPLNSAGTSFGSVCGSCYANDTANEWARSTATTAGGPALISLALTDAQATSGSFGSLTGSWTFAIRLGSTIGIVATKVTLLEVTYSKDDQGGVGGRPPPGIQPCEDLGCWLVDRTQAVRVFLVREINLWAWIFLILIVLGAIYVYVKRKRIP